MSIGLFSPYFLTSPGKNLPMLDVFNWIGKSFGTFVDRVHKWMSFVYKNVWLSDSKRYVETKAWNFDGEAPSKSGMPLGGNTAGSTSGTPF